MRNWKRLKPDEIARDPERLDELTEPAMAIIHCKAKGDRLPSSFESSGKFLVNCDGIPMFNGSKGLWRLDALCERYRVWYYPVPAFDGVS